MSGCSAPHRPAPAAVGATSTPVAAPSQPQLPTLEPALVPRDVPWRLVGPDWQLVTTLEGPPTPEGVEPRKARIQLVDPEGRRTDVVVMDRGVLGGADPGRWSTWVPRVDDVSAVDRTVLLRFTARGFATTAVALDLRTGRQRRARVPAGAGGLLLTDGGFAYLGAAGRLVSAGWDGTTTRVGRTDGTVLSLPDRRAVVTGHPMRVLGLDGSQRRLAEPSGTDGCSPRRWWDPDTIVATCSDGSLWLVPIGGAAPTRLTRPPAPHGTVMDFGADDAVRVGGETYVQKIPGCGTGWLARVKADGTTTELDGTRSQQLVDVVGDRLLVIGVTPCGRATGLVLLEPATLARTPILTLGRHEQLHDLRSWAGVPVLVR